MGGGCIANATRIETNRGPLFLKWQPVAEADALRAEAEGLHALREAESPLIIPHVRFQGVSDEAAAAILVMDWVEAAPPTPRFWERFGADLAALHRHTAVQYGFEDSNVIGRLPQRNEWCDHWPEFFAERRLAPQVERARALGRWQQAWDRPMEHLLASLEDLLPDQPPASILHGDLWSGNFIASRNDTAALVDPAAYHGDRETDLAMTELFGGFDARFYDSYRSAWPLERGYADRRDLYNLYHLINHLNHFGAGYASSVDRVLRRF